MLSPSYNMLPPSYSPAGRLMLLGQNSPEPQGEAGEALTLRALESQQRYINQKQDGATVTLRRVLEVFLDQEEQESDYLPPSDFAFVAAYTLIRSANSKTVHNFPQGSVTADGAGGMRVQWQRKQGEVRLVIPARRGGREYIYHEQGDAYATEKEVTPENLAYWLDQLA